MMFAPEHTASGIFSYIFDGLSDNNILSGGRLNFLVNYTSERYASWGEVNLLDGYYTFDITANLAFADYIF